MAASGAKLELTPEAYLQLFHENQAVSAEQAEEAAGICGRVCKGTYIGARSDALCCV